MVVGERVPEVSSEKDDCKYSKTSVIERVASGYDEAWSFGEQGRTSYES